MTRFVSLRLMNQLKEEEGEKPQGKAGLVQGLSPRLDQCHAHALTQHLSVSQPAPPGGDFFGLLQPYSHQLGWEARQ